MRSTVPDASSASASRPVRTLVSAGPVSRFEPARQAPSDPPTRLAALERALPVRRGSALSRRPRPDGSPPFLPVREDLAPLFPWGGLRPGGTVAVRDSAALLLALLAEATAGGSWAALVGIPDLGVLAAAELGVAVDRLALVPQPGVDIVGVTAALLDGFDIVAVVAPRITQAHARRLSARARHRDAALIAFGSWPSPDLELRCSGGRWSGLGDGHGHLRGHVVDVYAQGRGSAARPFRASITLQGDSPTPPSFVATRLLA
ncbi:hypothetical protein [Actinokineospora sp. HUAS TT18]|uniref:hypothetical protein n=1 Tax=Actinokineospora sp. HUAS TT18 TaxID=3447451 RepID=UPI003F51B9B2